MFVNIRDVNPRRRYSALAIGQRVRFEIGKNPNSNRTCAVNVELVEPVISPRVVAFSDEDDEPSAMADVAFMRQ